MKRAAVYSGPVRPGGADRANKEIRVHARLDAAFAAVADLERHRVGDDASPAASRPTPGLMSVDDGRPVVALGLTAHTALSHVKKRTLIAEDLDLEHGGDAGFDEEIEHLVWSCVNTVKIVALGERAWQSIQLLPIANRRFYNMPPLNMGSASGEILSHGVLVINHDGGNAKALTLAEVLDRAGMKVRCIGMVDQAAGAPQDCWADDALFHIHIGEHSLASDEPRLVDSWHSERLTLQLVSGHSRAGSHPYTLAIEDEANGFICATARDVISVCHDLLEDRVLQRKVIAAGQNSVAPLVKTWQAIAEDLLA